MTQFANKPTEAQKYAMPIRPQVGGFPVLAEVFRLAGVRMNRWSLPACQSIYFMEAGTVVQQGTPLVTGTHLIANCDRDSLIAAIETDQEGRSSFPEFLQAAWKTGVIGYDADFSGRKVTHYGSTGECYLEEYHG